MYHSGSILILLISAGMVSSGFVIGREPSEFNTIQPLCLTTIMHGNNYNI